MPTKESPQDLAALLLSARDGLGLTQDEAAKRSGVGLRTYIRWEHGENRPQAANLGKLAGALRIEYGELARAAGDHETPIDVQAKEARAHADAAAADVVELRGTVETLTAEVERLQGLVRAYRAPDRDELVHLVTEAVRRELNPGDAAMDAVLEPEKSRS